VTERSEVIPTILKIYIKIVGKSNHSGIETNTYNNSRFLWIGLNRTIVELRQELLLSNHIRDYRFESNHSGISAKGGSASG